MNGYYFDLFVLPFTVGAVVMMIAVAAKWSTWLWRLSPEEWRLVRHNIFTRKTFGAIGEVFSQSLLHRRIWQRNPLLGYMHTSLAFGWFLLIVVGWVEASVILGRGTPLQAHVFFRYFDPSSGGGNRILAHTMDFLLLAVLSGVALAFLKRARKRLFGMRRKARHSPFDRLAMTTLWLIFPLRLLAESTMAAIKHNGGFLTEPIGRLFDSELTVRALVTFNDLAWWSYSVTLGLFFVALPFSRYMHIFTEIPLIFLRRYRLHSAVDRPSGYDHFQEQSCSACGICIEECALGERQGAMHFIEARRHEGDESEKADHCMMCGRCTAVCPVGIELDTLRLQSRAKERNSYRRGRYDYVASADGAVGSGRVGYFIGCMGRLSTATTASMARIFAAAGEQVWWADRDGGVCCGRPLRLTGQIEAAEQLQRYNSWLFRTGGIKLLVTACPICLRTFREDYRLDGIRVLHHSEYIAELIGRQRINVVSDRRRIAYHDPCELGRGLGIYTPPRDVVRSVATLIEPPHNHAASLCCGESIADLVGTPSEQKIISRRVLDEFEACRVDAVATACPLCQKSLSRGGTTMVADIAVLTASNLIRINKSEYFAQTENLTTFVP